MKIAITTTGNNLNDDMDSRFGRTVNFLIYDTDKKDFLIVENKQNLEAAHGAGIQAAETVAKTGASIVITGHCGPKAFRVLKTAGIKIFSCKNSTVKDALKSYEDGNITEINETDI